jgi:hypothetical protein
MEFNIQLSPIDFSFGGDEVHDALTYSTIQSITPQEFGEYIGRQNYSFNACIHRPEIKQDGRLVQNSSTAISWQILALDFDSEEKVIHPDKVLEILAKNIGLPNLIYTTRRNDEQKNTLYNAIRFRVIYILPEPIQLNDYELAKRTHFYKMFSHFFESLDTVVFDTNRYFFGGKCVLYENYENFISYDVLDSLSEILPIVNFGNKAYSSKLKKISLAKEKEGFFVISNRYNIENTKKTHYPIRMEREDWELAMEHCPLLIKFFNANEKIYHNELFLLYLLLDRFSGGIKIWNKLIEINPYINHIEKSRTINDWIKKEKKLGRLFHEPPLQLLYPNAPTSHPQYITSLFKNSKNRKPRKVDSKKIITKDISIIRRDLVSEIEYFLRVGGVKLLKSPTGTGKTETKLDLLIKNEDYRKNLILAYPRHDLIIEKEKKLIEHHIPYVRVLPLPNFLSPKLNMEKEKHFNRGFKKKFRKILMEIYKDNSDVITKYEVEKEDYDAIYAYVESLEKAKCFEGLILTTHHSTFFHDFPNHNRIIYDENPLDSMLQIYSVSFSEFVSAILMIPEFFNNLKKLQEDIQKLQDSENHLKWVLNPFDTEDFDDRILEDIDIKDIGHILTASKFYVVHRDGKPEKLICSKLHSPKVFKDILIMSATANELKLKKVFEDLVVIDLGEVKLVGKAIQFINKSYSKLTLNYEENLETFKKISGFSGDTAVIAINSSKLKKIFKIDGNYQNNSGSNAYIGKDILIIGTPFLEDFVVPIWADTLGIDFTTTEMNHYTVVRHGYEFTIFTYADLVLREIQFKWMESLIIQAVGRARLVNENRKVAIFCKLPYHLAEIILDYKEKDIPEFLQTKFHLTGSFVFGKEDNRILSDSKLHEPIETINNYSSDGYYLLPNDKKN